MGHAPGIKIAAWAKAEQRKKDREENRGSVRAIFGLLFCAAVMLFIFSERTEWQPAVASKVSRTLWSSLHSAQPDLLEQNAVKHENEVNEISR